MSDPVPSPLAPRAHADMFWTGRYAERTEDLLRLLLAAQAELDQPGAYTAGVLADIRQNHRVAAVFALPSSHRTVQLKGEDARVLPFDPADHAIVARHLETFVAELAHLGIPEAIIRTVYGCPGSDLVAVAFTPCAAFSQTPGPRAGQPLGAAP